MTTRWRISKRDTVALAVGAAAVALLVGVRGAPMIRSQLVASSLRTQLVSDNAAIARMSVQDAPRTSDSLVSRIAQLNRVRSELLRKGTSAQLAADLHDLVTSSARDVGLQVFSASAQGDTTTTTPLTSTSIRIDAEGDVAGVIQFLFALELAPGLLQVRDLSIAQPDPAGTLSTSERLRVAVTLDGVSLRESRTAVTPGKPE